MNDKVLEVWTSPGEEPYRVRYCRSWPRTAFSEEAKFCMDIAKMTAMGGTKKGAEEIPYTPEQVAERAVKITELLFAAMKDKGWTELVPTLDELRLEETRTMGFSEKAA